MVDRFFQKARELVSSGGFFFALESNEGYRNSVQKVFDTKQPLEEEFTLPDDKLFRQITFESAYQNDEQRERVDLSLLFYPSNFIRHQRFEFDKWPQSADYFVELFHKKNIHAVKLHEDPKRSLIRLYGANMPLVFLGYYSHTDWPNKQQYQRMGNVVGLGMSIRPEMMKKDWFWNNMSLFTQSAGILANGLYYVSGEIPPTQKIILGGK